MSQEHLLNNCTVYPWQQPYWQRFQQQAAQKKRPHALLLGGQKGIGKWKFATCLAHSVLCLEHREGIPCGHCRACLLNRAGSHPDLLTVTPEQQERFIKIDQVRQLTNFVSKTPQQGHVKVVLLGPVEALNLNASNALLKSLEEPAGNTLLLLVTHVQSVVMATIRSRCQLMPMIAPNRQQTIAWLKTLQLSDDSFNRTLQLLPLAAGAPLAAKAMATHDHSAQVDMLIDGLETAQQGHSSIKIAAQWLDIQLITLLEWWLQIVSLIIKRHFAIDDVKMESSTDDILDKLYLSCKYYPVDWLFRFSDKLLTLKRQFFTGANLNKQLLLEELLLDWQAMGRRSRVSDYRSGSKLSV